MTGSRSPTAGQPDPSWSSDSDRAAWRRTASTSSGGASVRPTTTPSSRWWTTTAALEDHPGASTGNAMTIDVPSTPPPPMPGVNPPAKSCAEARSNGPRGTTSKVVIGPTVLRPHAIRAARG